jgi:phenylalanyl-tRNA synthetase beta chain
MLVIADASRPIAIAGVMGGAPSEVSGATTRIALESAWFQPASVRATSRRLGLKTEASARFERGADISAPTAAIDRAIALLETIGAGCATAPVTDVYPRPVEPRSVRLRQDHLSRLLGDQIPSKETERILARLGFGVAPDREGWAIAVPTWRVDVLREADLIEEVGRHWGFDRIPATFPPLNQMPGRPAPAVVAGRTVRRILTGSGLQEAVTFTFIEHAAAVPFVETPDQLVPLANPLSEKFAVLRPSLLPGLVDALIYNRRRESDAVRLFEVGSIFGPHGERHAVAWVMTGSRGQHWSGAPAAVDFFDAKGTAELLATAFGAIVDAEADELPYFVRGQSARIIAMTTAGAVRAGSIGQIRPELAVARGLGQGEAIVAGEIDLSALVRTDAGEPRAVIPLPRYPSIVRDLSIVVDERLPAATVRGTIRASGPATLVTVREFDRYQGPGVPNGRVSLSVRLTFRAGDRTLTDAEVQQAVDRIVNALAREHGATLRGQ